MHQEHPLKKKYDPKCVPVRRVSAWEREQIEKRQRHLKVFKGQKWQKLHRENELRKAKAAAAGVRYVRLSSVRSSSIAPNKVARVSAATRTRVVRFTARKKNSHKPREHLTPQSTKKTFTNNKIPLTAYHPRPKKYRYKREPPPPTPLTLQNIKKFRMEERRKRKARGGDYDDFEIDAAADAVSRLHKLISEDANSVALIRGVRLIRMLRDNAPPREINPTLEHAEKVLFQIINQGYDISDIRLQSDKVQRLSGGIRPTAPRLAEEDLSERRKPAETELGQDATTGPSEAPLAATKGAPEQHNKPSKPKHGNGRVPADYSTVPVPAEKDIRERGKSRKPDHGSGREATGSPPAPAPAARDTPERTRPTQADHGSRQENRQAETPLDTGSRHRQPPKAQAPASSVGNHLDPPSPVLQDRQPAPAPKPVHTRSHEKKRPEAPLETTTLHNQRPKSQAPVFSAGDDLDPPPPPRPAGQPLPEPKPAPIQRQQDKRAEKIPEDSTRANRPTTSNASASSLGDPLDAPSPPQRVSLAVPLPRPSPLQRQQTARSSTALEASARSPQRPQSNASASSLASRFDRPSIPQRGRYPAPFPRPSQTQQQQNVHPKTASAFSARPPQRPQSNASASSLASHFDRPSSPQRGRQPAPLLRPSQQQQQQQQQQNERPSTAPGPSTRPPQRPQSSASVSSRTSSFAIPRSPSRGRQPPPLSSQPHRQQHPARPGTAPASSAPTNKRPRSSASLSSHTSSFAAPRSPPRGRQRANSAATPPPPKRRRPRTTSSPNRYPPSDSPSPPPPRAPGIPPRPRFKAKSSITDREDKASRSIMHPASEPLAKLSDFEKAMTRGSGFDGMGGARRRQAEHPSFRKAREMGNVNFKHVRHVNRAGGRREEKVVERSVFERIGMPPGLGRGGQAQAGAGQAGAGQVQAGQARGAGSAGPSVVAASARSHSLGTSVGTGNEQTIEDLIAAQYGCSEVGGDEEEGVVK